MAEFWRALRTFKALQAEQAVQQPAEAAIAMAAPASRPGAQVSDRPGPNEPERRAALRLDYAMPAPPLPGRTLHEPAALWLPNEPDSDRQPAPAPTPPGPVPTHPEPRRGRSAVPADTIAAPRRSG